MTTETTQPGNRPRLPMPLISELQRFLADCRTNDAFLQPCFQFVQTLPPAGKSEDLARELAGFFGLETAVKLADENGAAKSVPVRLEGQYRIYVRYRKKKIVVLGSERGYSTCTVTGDGSRYTFREEVFNPAMSMPVPKNSTRHTCEGILLFFDPLIFVVAKNLLTRLPRVYWLRDLGEGLLLGNGMEALFLHEKDAVRPYSDKDFAFKRISEGAES